MWLPRAAGQRLLQGVTCSLGTWAWLGISPWDSWVLAGAESGCLSVGVPHGEQSKQIPVVRVWEGEDVSGFALTQVDLLRAGCCVKQAEGCYSCLQLEDEEWEDWE